jgi:hypothetical protein
MNLESSRQIHDISAALYKIHGFIELAESGYDFSSSHGHCLVEAAKQALSQLENNVLTAESIGEGK